MAQFYERVWKVKVPERIRVFIWLVTHQVIMTNVERYRRHLSDTEICQVCKGGLETILHVLRDCLAMRGIWERLVHRSRRNLFFGQSLFEWLFENLGNHSVIDGVPWSTLFAVGVWWGWKWRCENVFGGNKLCRDRIRVIRDLGREIVQASAKQEAVLVRRERVERQVMWIPPNLGWYKVNTDGASRGNPGLASAGGVLRSPEGEWSGGFALNIGICSAPLAELWGVYYGLCIAWDKRVERLELEVDSELVVGFFTTGVGELHPLSFLVRLCHGLLAKNWIVRVSHVYREANCLADGLANYAFSLPLGLHLLNYVPLDVVSLLRDDVSGLSRPRQVRL